MSADVIVIPYAADLNLQDLNWLEREHESQPLELGYRFDDVALGYGPLDDQSPERLVAQLLRLARFALLVREIAECRPTDTVVDVVNQVHNELRSRP